MVQPLPESESDAYRSLVDRRASAPGARAAAQAIIDDVRRGGDAAVQALTERLDGVRLSDSRVGADAIAAAQGRLDPELAAALAEAMRRIETVHRAQLRGESRSEPVPGLQVWREWRPFQRVGLYVPGGRARYPSSVLMLAVPARLAGCREVVLCSPPQPDGNLPDVVLAAAAISGVTEVHRVGGAQAIAALAYGTERLRRVDKIFGPGNAYVTAAKLLVVGEVAVDMPAGPSELVIVTDGSAPAGWLAADLLAQAEHAPDAIGVLVSTDAGLAAAIAAVLGQAAAAQIRLFTATDLERAIRFADDFAPEHLALDCEDAARWLPAISRAGSVFLGSYSPPAAGDYATGANHVLPTGGSARSFGGLGVEAFGRMVQVQAGSRSAIDELIRVAAPLATVEGLAAHRRSIEIRNAAP